MAGIYTHSQPPSLVSSTPLYSTAFHPHRGLVPQRAQGLAPELERGVEIPLEPQQVGLGRTWLFNFWDIDVPVLLGARIFSADSSGEV